MAIGDRGSGSSSSVSPLLFRVPNDVLYDYALSSAYRSDHVYDPSIALAKDPDIWEVVRRDSGILGSIERYTSSVVRPWHVDAPSRAATDADHKLAGIVTDAIDCIYGFDDSRRVLAESAFLGRRYAYIESEVRTISLDGNPEMDWIVPIKLKDIDRRRVRMISTIQGLYPRQTRVMTQSLYNTISTRWEDFTPEFKNSLIQYVWYNTEDRVENGRGWLEAIYYSHWMKTSILQKWMNGIDRWADGIWVGKIDGLRNSSTNATNAALQAGMKNVMRTMRTEHIAVIENVDDLKVYETNGTGTDMCERALGYLDQAVERLVNGSVRPVGLGGEKSGARAQAETESDSSESHYQPARASLDAVLDRDLVGWFLSQPQNRANIAQLNLLKARRPKFHSEQIKRENPMASVQVAEVLQRMGWKLSKKQLAERTGFEDAEDPEDILEAPVPEMTSPFGGGLDKPKKDDEDKKKPKSDE